MHGPPADLRRKDLSRQMSCSLNSLKGVIWGIIYGTTIRITKGDTRSLDSGSDDEAKGFTIHAP